MPRIEEPSPPGVSRTSTIASYPSSSARSTEFSTYSCVTGLMSLSRWTARTRGESAWASTPGAATSAPRASARTRIPRKQRLGTGVRILSAEVRRSCPRTTNGPPWIPVHRLLAPLTAVLAVLLVAPTALAGEAPRVATVDLRPNGSGRFLPSHALPRFTLAGVSWRGSGRVEFRTRAVDGAWSAWRQAAPEDEDGADLGSAERRRRGWRLGNPWWVGVADGIQARTAGVVSSVRAQLVWSPERRLRIRVPASTVTPAIVPRSEWGANEAIRRAPPTYASGIRFAIVHHTAGGNT